eukprot:16427817-Heterocapsa_arctica.AAC.1
MHRDAGTSVSATACSAWAGDSILWTRAYADDNETVVGVLGVHVGDIVMAAFKNYEFVVEAVKNEFDWGSEWDNNDFIFCGRHMWRNEDGSIEQDQAYYVSDFDLIILTEFSYDELLSAHPELITEFRSNI